MDLPVRRGRRLRYGEQIRRMVTETLLAPQHLVAPVFVKAALRAREPIPSVPGHHVHTLQSLTAEVAELIELGIPAVILFGIPADKDAQGSSAWAPDGIIPNALRLLRAEFREQILLIADLCLCAYTDHGHCGVLVPHSNGEARATGGVIIDDDVTVGLYARLAVEQGKAGADFVAPSGMMDGQVGVIRHALDASGHGRVGILAYSVKYASSLYAPFRGAAESAPVLGDRRSYQLPTANRREALLEVETDIEEGADIIMVKPALPSLDILREIRTRFEVPLAAYQVSGEYAMIKAAGAQKWIDEREAAIETLLAIRRAGADMILTYFAKELATWWRYT